VLLYLGFCDPCWYLWHAKGSLRQHQKKPVLTGVTTAQEQNIHKEGEVSNGMKQQYVIPEAYHASGVASTLDVMLVCQRYFQSYYSSYLKA